MMRLSTSALLIALGAACLSQQQVSSFTPPSFSSAATNTKKLPQKGEASKGKQLSKEELQGKFQQVEQELRKKHDNDAFNALFVSCKERKDPIPITETQGKLPADFPPGCLMRLGPNGADPTDGFFDGDGMVQCITFPPSDSEYKPSFSATYVETKGRQLEQQSGFTKKFRGTLGGVPEGLPMLQSIFQNAITFKTLQAQKDTCNTALAEHGGRVLALMEQSPPTEIEIYKDGRVKTIESCSTLDGAIQSAPISGGTFSAHGRTCPDTGDRVHVSYRSDAKPYLRMDVFSPGWALKESIGIDIPAPIFLHDCAITRNYVVIFDLPLTLRINRIFRNRFPVEYEPSHSARIGLVHRTGGDIKWFDCDPGVVLHASNAWESEDGKTVTIQGLWGEPRANECYLESFAPSFFYEYSIDLETRKLSEQCLNADVPVEFPIIDENFTGKECSACYCISVKSVGGPLDMYQQPKEGVVFDGVVKLAATDMDGHQKGDVIGRFSLPGRWYAVSESTVIPKENEQGGEYVAVIATNIPESVTWQDVEKDPSMAESQVIILDGADLESGPIYTATLPYMVPYGLHSGYFGWESILK